MKPSTSLWLHLIVIASVVPLADAEASTQETIIDFEQEGLGDRWTARGKIKVSRLPLPEECTAQGDVPAGSGVRVRTEGKAGLYTLEGAIDVDWQDLEEIVLWVYRAADENRDRDTATIELRLLEADGDALFWRRVVLDHHGWRKVSVPLRYCRWGSGRIPEWRRISRVGVYFRDPAELWLDQIGVVDDPYGPGTVVPLGELCSQAFPGVAEADVQALVREDMHVLTDCADLDLELLEIHLDGVLERVRADLPFLDRPRVPPRLIVFAEREDYRAFPSRLAAQFASNMDPPSTDGFTFMACATGSWKESYGTLRPTFTHEFVHALIARSVLLQNRSEWFQEGLANHYQLLFHPQEGLGDIVKKGVETQGWHLPLNRLCDGQSIPTNRYWQAVTVIEMLMGSPKYGDRFAELVRALQAAGSTDLGPHLEAILGVDDDELTADWKAYCRATYTPEEER